MMTYAEVLQYLHQGAWQEGVPRTAAGLSSMRSRGAFPEPDVVVGRTPTWTPETIDLWLDTRLPMMGSIRQGTPESRARARRLLTAVREAEWLFNKHGRPGQEDKLEAAELALKEHLKLNGLTGSKLDPWARGGDDLVSA